MSKTSGAETTTKTSKRTGRSGRALRAACAVGVASAAAVAMVTAPSSAHALTIGVGGGIVITLPIIDAGINLPILPTTDAGSISIPIVGTDAGIVIDLPLLPTTDAGTITLPLVGQDGGIVSLPGFGTDAGVALLCTNDASCATGFFCDDLLKICLPDIPGLTPDAGSSAGKDAGEADAGEPGETTETPDAGDTGNGGGGSEPSGGGATTVADGGASSVTVDGSGNVTVSASAKDGGSVATADGGSAANEDASDDGNGVGCSVSSTSTKRNSFPLELVLGLVGFVSFGALRRRQRAARKPR